MNFHWVNVLSFRRISAKLMFAFTLFIAVPLILSGTLIFSKTRNVIERNINDYSQSTLKYVSTEVKNLMEQYDVQLVDIYNRKQMFAELAHAKGITGAGRLNSEMTINDELNKYLYQHSFVDTVFLLATDGNIYYASKTGMYNRSIAEVFKRDGSLMKQIRDLNGNGLWFPMQVGDGDELFFSRTLKEIYGDFHTVGTLLLKIDQSSLSRIIFNSYLPDDASLYIFNKNGAVILDKEGSSRIKDDLQKRNLKQILKGNSGITTIRSNEVEYATIHLKSNYNDWQYVELIRKDQLTSLIFEIKQYFTFIALISVLFFIIVTFLVSQYITNPLRKLTRAMAQVKNGNLDATVRIRSHDEVGLLGNSFNAMRIQIKQLIKDIQVAGLREKEAEIQSLKAQFNPHFLYNSLGAVNWQAVKNGQLEISDMLTDLADILRYSLDKDSGDMVTIREDIRWLKKYVNLQKERFDFNFEVVFTVDPYLLDFKVHKLVFQPMIENSIIHGFKAGYKGWMILVTIQERDQELHVELTDNGAGMDDEKTRHILSGGGKGLGLKIVNERLRLYYGENYGLKVDSEPGQGTTVILRMPLIGE